MSRWAGFSPKTRERWAILIANADGLFWQYATKRGTYKDPVLLPNRASATAYSAWLQNWAAMRPSFMHSNRIMVPVNIDTVDFSEFPKAWPEALNELISIVS